MASSAPRQQAAFTLEVYFRPGFTGGQKAVRPYTSGGGSGFPIDVDPDPWEYEDKARSRNRRSQR